MIYEVYHKAFEENGTHVANVTLPDEMPVKEALEVVFRKTNNVDGSWSKGPHYEYDGVKYDNQDYSKEVEVVKPLVIDDHGKEWGHRSTSCGDYVMVNGKKYLCAMVGWELC